MTCSLRRAASAIRSSKSLRPFILEPCLCDTRGCQQTARTIDAKTYSEVVLG
jgi:hypothetical protein